MSKSSKRISVKLDSKTVVEQSKEYVRQRKDGEISSYKTKLKKLNRALMGGIEGNTILCISALSGAGKSTLAKVLRDSIADLNPTQKFKQYLFNYEITGLYIVS